MEPLGMGAARAVTRVADRGLQATRLRTLALPAKKEANGLPVRFDRDVDFEIPRRLICWRPDGQPVELRRSMRPDELALVESRSAALTIALEPYGMESRDELKAAIGAMFSGFRSMRQQGDDVESVIAITLAVLRDFPAWAITMGCLKIARRETKIDPRFAPNDAEIAEVISTIVKSYREALEAVSKLLNATVKP